MYRILLTRGHKAYAVECADEFNEYGDIYDNVFDENIHEFVDNGDVVVLMEDIDEFDRFIKGYELEIIKKDE